MPDDRSKLAKTIRFRARVTAVAKSEMYLIQLEVRRGIRAIISDPSAGRKIISDR